MTMTLNEVLSKQNLITKIVLANGSKELPKELKIKIMRIRMAYNKVKKQFDQDVEDFTKEIVTDELRDLANNKERNEEQEARFEELNSKVNSEYMEFVNQKGREEVKDEIEDSLTEDEYADILDINTEDVEINNVKIKAADFMEIIYTMFVK